MKDKVGCSVFVRVHTTYLRIPLIIGRSACRTCGSSTLGSTDDKASCICTGANRRFSPTDGACVCESRFVFVDTISRVQTDSDGVEDCQIRVHLLYNNSVHEIICTYYKNSVSNCMPASSPESLETRLDICHIKCSVCSGLNYLICLFHSRHILDVTVQPGPVLQPLKVVSLSLMTVEKSAKTLEVEAHLTHNLDLVIV